MEKLNRSTKEFSGGIFYNHSFPTVEEELWVTPYKGWTKINCDVAFRGGTTTLAMVAHDDEGILILATTKLVKVPSIFMRN